MTGALARFLGKNSIPNSATMPLVHTTTAYRAKKVIQNGFLDPQNCDVFNEELLYLFYGRPAYKKHSSSQISKYWELPTVFILDYDVVKKGRIYPFDTGAFMNRRYPDFFNMMDLDDYDVGHVFQAPQRIVGSFFVDANRYFRLRPRDHRDFIHRFEVASTDEEIRSLFDLALHYSDRIDDRRFSIEVQTRLKISLRNNGLVAVILPEEYFENEEFISLIEDQGARAIPYPTHSLKQEMYYSQIYNYIYELYKELGLAR
jgi:hypothetical protein